MQGPLRKLFILKTDIEIEKNDNTEINQDSEIKSY